MSSPMPSREEVPALIRLRKGQPVRVRAAGTSDEWSRAVVGVATENITPHQSVALILDGAVRARGGFIVGALPLLVDYESELLTGLDGMEYELMTCPVFLDDV